MRPVVATHPARTNIRLRLERRLQALRHRVEFGFHALGRSPAAATREAREFLADEDLFGAVS